MEWELSVTPEQGGQLAEQVFVFVIVFFFGFVFVFVLTPDQGGGQLAEQANIEFFFFFVFVPFFGFVFVFVFVLTPEQGGGQLQANMKVIIGRVGKMPNKDCRTGKYLKVIIVIFLKQPWHTLVFALCISCPLDFIKRLLNL